MSRNHRAMRGGHPVTFDMFDDLVSQEFHAPARHARHVAAIKQAFSEANRRFGDFLRQAADSEEFESRCMLVAAEMQPIWDKYHLRAEDRQKVVDHLKVSDTWENPDHKSDKCTTTEDAANTATSVPWGEAGPTPPQSGTEEENDATLYHISSWFKDDPVSGVDFGDPVVLTQDSYDSVSGQPVNGGQSGTVQDINGGDVTVEVNGGDIVVPVQDIERVGRVAAGNEPRNPGPPQPSANDPLPPQRDDDPFPDDPLPAKISWTWDAESNSYKASTTTPFTCPCGRRLSGVGQHRCVCGKVWNMSCVMNGSKTAQDTPVYSCREVKTDDRLMLAGIQPYTVIKHRLADHADERAHGLRGDCQMCTGTGNLYGINDCPGCKGTGNASGQSDFANPGTTWTPPNYQSSRRADAQPTCVHCGQSVTHDPSVVGNWVTDDGWGSVCGTSGAHEPAGRTSHNNGTGNDPAKGGPGGNDDPPQPDLVMEPEDPSYVEPYNKGARVARILRADAGLWPLLDDKDIQANWKSLLGIIMNPAQVGALEHEQYQGLVQDLYDEINRRGLNTPVDQQQMMDPSQQLVNPGQQAPQPSPSAFACRRMGFNAALAGVAPALDEPIECFQGWVLGLNKRIADSYQDRETVYDGSEPATPGHPVNSDSLDPGANITDPTPSQRADLAGDADARNAEGKSDDEVANHPDDLEPVGQKHL